MSAVPKSLSLLHLGHEHACRPAGSGRAGLGQRRSPDGAAGTTATAPVRRSSDRRATRLGATKSTKGAVRFLDKPINPRCEHDRDE